MTAITRSIPTVLRVLLTMVRRSVRTELFALLFVLTVPAQPLQAAATGWVGGDPAAARLITAVAATGSGSTIDDKDASITTRVNERIAKDAYPKKAGIHAQTNAGVVSLSGEVQDFMTSAQAAWIAWQVPGVKFVKDDLTVKDRPKVLLTRHTSSTSVEFQPQWRRRTTETLAESTTMNTAA